MTKITHLLSLILFVFTTAHAFSQDSQSRAQKLTDNMKTKLSLTDEQVIQVLPVNQAFVESLQALRTSGEGKLNKYKKFKAADNKRDQALRALLTSEQYHLFEKNKKENRAALKEARRNKG